MEVGPADCNQLIRVAKSNTLILSSSASIHLPHLVLSLFATVPSLQGVQELAPSRLMLFPSQDTQNVPLTGR